MTTETLEAPTGTQDAAATTPAVEAQQVEQKEPATEAPAASESEAKPEAEKPKEPQKLSAGVQRRIDKLTALSKSQAAELAQLRQASPADETANKEPADIHTLAMQMAKNQLAQERFASTVNSVYDAGVKEYKADFDTAIGSLRNVLGDDEWFPMLGAIVDAGNTAPGVLMHFAQNPEEAMAFADLSPRAQGRELARIEASLEAKRTAKPTSAPPPVSSVGSSGSASKSIEDMSMSEYMEYRKKTRK